MAGAPARQPRSAPRRWDHVELRGLDDERAAYLSRFKADGGQSLADLRKTLQKAANRHLLVIRTAAGLEAFIGQCRAIHEALVGDAAIVTPTDWVHALELENLCEVGELMAKAALERRESRGGHYREDFPSSDPAQATSIVLDKSRPLGGFRARMQDIAA